MTSEAKLVLYTCGDKEDGRLVSVRSPKTGLRGSDLQSLAMSFQVGCDAAGRKCRPYWYGPCVLFFLGYGLSRGHEPCF